MPSSYLRDREHAATVFEQWVGLATRVRAIRSQSLHYIRNFYKDAPGSFCLQHRTEANVHVSSTAIVLLEILRDPSLLEEFERLVDRSFRKKVLSTLDTAVVTTGTLHENNIYTSPIYIVAMAALTSGTTTKMLSALDAVIGSVSQTGVRWTADWEPSGLLAYWSWRAVSVMADRLPAKEKRRANLCLEQRVNLEVWAAHEFYRQLSLGIADQSGFDPMNLGYAMSICMGRGDENPLTMDLVQNALTAIFTAQAKDGIWPSYGGIFPDPTRGTVHVFAPEMLSVLLAEMRARPGLIISVFDGLSALVSWIELNERRGETKVGWTSNHLPSHIPPESWSSAVILGTLREVDRLSRAIITDSVVKLYDGKPSRGPDATLFQSLLDSDTDLGGADKTVKGVLDQYLLQPRRANPSTRDARRSMILFGPRGTAKTSYAEAIAQSLGWPLISLTVGDFLGEGISHAFAQAHDVFRRLMEAENVVVLFDEFEEFVRDRSKATDIENRLFTGDMLTLLQDLHDQGRGIYIIATNYAEEFDKAVKRPGRFDIILNVMPPSRPAKEQYLVERLQAQGIAHGQVKKFLNQRYQSDIRPMIFGEWREYVSRVIEEMKTKKHSDLTTALGAVLDDSFRQPLLGDDELKFAEKSRIF
jgi:hypothetical protein